jgi:polyisoprenoid-binding protein YceI
MNPIRKAAICLVLLSSAAAAYAERGHWRLDPVHTRVLFKVEHAGFSTALGLFPDIRGELRLDPADWRDATLEVRVPLARLQIGDDDWRDKLLSRTWLHAGRQPEAVFRSIRVETAGEDTARVHGTLSLRGESAPVVLDVRLNKHARNPLTFRETAGFSATATLDRRDLGMAEWPNVVGQRVELEIQAEAIRYTPSADEERRDADPQHD